MYCLKTSWCVPQYNCQKHITFPPRQFQLEGSGFKNTVKNDLRDLKQLWIKFLKPAVIVAANFIGMAVWAKARNPKVEATLTNILKSISEGKILSVTDMHGHELRLKVM